MAAATIKMNNLFLCLIALITSACFAPAVLADSDTSDRVGQVISTVFQPAIASFKDDAEVLSNSIQQDCQADDTMAAYREAAISFSKIEFLQLGQLLKEDRLERLFFWPDRKAIGQRQLRRLLTDPELASLSLSDLEKKSVALQGFPALARILFQSDQMSDPVCHYASVVAENLSKIATELYDDWHRQNGIAFQLSNPESTSAYRTHLEATAAVLTLADNGLRSLRDRKLAHIIEGVFSKKALPGTSPFYHGELTFQHLRANLDAMSSIVLDTRLSEGVQSLEIIRDQFQRAYAMIDESTLALSSGEINMAFQRLAALESYVDDIHERLREDIMAHRGISAGFNSSDGD